MGCALAHKDNLTEVELRVAFASTQRRYVRDARKRRMGLNPVVAAMAGAQGAGWRLSGADTVHSDRGEVFVLSECAPGYLAAAYCASWRRRAIIEHRHRIGERYQLEWPRTETTPRRMCTVDGETLRRTLTTKGRARLTHLQRRALTR